MQEAIVTLIVFCATVVVIKRYAPNSWKRATRACSARIAAKIGWHTLAARIVEKAEDGASCGTGCGSCGSCGTDGAMNTPAEKESSISIDALKRTIRR